MAVKIVAAAMETLREKSPAGIIRRNWPPVNELRPARRGRAALRQGPFLRGGWGHQWPDNSSRLLGQIPPQCQAAYKQQNADILRDAHPGAKYGRFVGANDLQQE